MFDEEYEAHHPKHSDTESFVAYSLNWETFDKDDVQPAFSISIDSSWVHLFDVPDEAAPPLPCIPGIHPIRDKSPPILTLTR